MSQILNLSIQLLHSVVNKVSDFVNPPQGKTYLVTGASRGIGKAIAIELAKQGKNLVLVARNESNLNAVQKEIFSKYKVEVHVIPFDVTDYDDVEELLKTATAKSGPIDSIILNAGVANSHKVGKNGFSQDLRVIETNLLAPIALINAFVGYAKSNKIENPHVIVVTSVGSDLVTMYLGAYCGSKSGLTKYIESCALELEKENFYFTNVQPGFVDTDMTNGLSKTLGQYLAVTPEWCAKEICFAINRRQRQRYIPHWLYYPIGISN